MRDLTTALILLAAGASTRMGLPKQLARLGDETLITRALRTARASGLSPILVVLGANADLIQQQTDFTGTQIILNDRWQQGMATSLHAGIAAAQSANCAAAVITACDMPFVTAEHLQALATLSAEQNSDTASLYPNGSRGIPACFRRESFAALAQLTGDTGAKSLLQHAPTVPLTNPTDVDTPAELQRAKGPQHTSTAR